MCDKRDKKIEMESIETKIIRKLKRSKGSRLFFGNMFSEQNNDGIINE